MTLTRLLIRRHRAMLATWLLLLPGLCGGTAPAYRSTYPTDDMRRAAAELARHDPAATLLYGRLPGPGTPAQMFTWEMGAIVSVLAAVFAVLLTVALTRAAEDDGTLELVRGCGTVPEQPLRSALTLLAGVAVVLGLGCGAAVGGPAFGAAIGLTFLVFAALTAVLSQVAATAGQARTLGFAALGAAFALRATGDVRNVGWLVRIGPLGLRETIAPFTADRWWVLAPALAVAGLLGLAAGTLSRRREFGAGLIPRRDTSDRRLAVRTAAGLAVRLGRSALLAWTAGVAALGALFAAMGSGTVTQSRDGALGGFLGSQLGTGDPAAAYLALCDTVAGIAVGAYAVLSVLAARRAEEDGRTGLLLASGVRRWAPLAAQTLFTAGGSALILVATGVLGALITPVALPGDDLALRSFGYATGQWPAAVAVAGCTALIIGISPRLAGLAWLPLGGSALLALLGNLLGVPRRIQELGFLRHVPDFAGPDPQVGGLLLLVALGVLFAVAGAAAVTRRDVAAG